MALALRADLRSFGIAPAIHVMWMVSWPSRCSCPVKPRGVWDEPAWPNGGSGVRHWPSAPLSSRSCTVTLDPLTRPITCTEPSRSVNWWRTVPVPAAWVMPPTSWSPL